MSADDSTREHDPIHRPLVSDDAVLVTPGEELAVLCAKDHRIVAHYDLIDDDDDEEAMLVASAISSASCSAVIKKIAKGKKRRIIDSDPEESTEKHHTALIK